MATKKKSPAIDKDTMKELFDAMLINASIQTYYRLVSDIKIKANYGYIYLETYVFKVPYTAADGTPAMLQFDVFTNDLETKDGEDKLDISVICTETIGDQSTVSRLYKHGSKVDEIDKRVVKKIRSMVTPETFNYDEYAKFRAEAVDSHKNFVGTYYD